MEWFGWLIFAFEMCGKFFDFLNRQGFNSLCLPPPPKISCETFCVYFDRYKISMLILFAIFAIVFVFLILLWISHKKRMNFEICYWDSEIKKLQLILHDLRRHYRRLKDEAEEETMLRDSKINQLQLNLQNLRQLNSKLKDDAEREKRPKNIEIASDIDSCNSIIDRLKSFDTEYRALGFDCEWIASGQRRSRVALIQLATASGICGLFRINKIGHVPDTLKDVLKDKTIRKVGVNSALDARYLRMDYNVEMSSVLDLRSIAPEWCFDMGLERMAKKFLNIELDKKSGISYSNWENSELTNEQIDYAAKDAIVGIKLYNYFNKHCDQMTQTAEDCYACMLENLNTNTETTQGLRRRRRRKKKKTAAVV
ncbi:bifunctional 3'-5' exonuclease/ATP-dependent helicase WRN-like isoform X4 [Phlebotomus papatasi]|uniref:bifunctional 3'-5' exonuclease/ATP-dependent helicase WRN-like isoform X4 n=1 Tax=Phlebotomus papatasi TaxID=29031 RepID=UPI00248399F2|nr:bifunctional 3'-5' exonuclease/ATP-dependent helicase WRN-like isoform X4 [Phlebotomus papatasi]